MQLGITLTVDKVMEEMPILTDLIDYVELLLLGDQASDRERAHTHFSSEDRISVVHLPDLTGACLESLKLAKRLMAEKAVVHFHTVKPAPTEEKMAMLQRLQEKANEYSIMLCLENTEEDINTFQNIFNILPDLRFCLDIGHANLFSNDPVDFISAFGDRLGHVHIHDNNGGDSEDFDIHLCPGEGSIDFVRVFQALKFIDYHETMTLELTPNDSVIREARCLAQVRRMIENYLSITFTS